MKRLMLRIAGLMVVFGALSVATAQAGQVSIHVGIGVPVAPVVVAPRVVVAPPVAVVGAPYPYPYAAYYGPAPYPGYAWRGGYYAGYRWVPGAWVAPPARVYAAPRYGYGSARVYHAHR